MGAQDVDHDHDAAQRRVFITRLLHDIQALETMIGQGMIESGVRRIGAEQELFLVGQTWRPAPTALETLDVADDPHYTTELGRFNLEINLDPLVFTATCLSQMEQSLEALLDGLRAAAQREWTN